MQQFTLYISELNKKSKSLFDKVHSTLTIVLSGQFELQIVEVLDNPEIALKNMVFVTPTLVRKSPAPQKKVFGNLKDQMRVLEGLALV